MQRAEIKVWHCQNRDCDVSIAASFLREQESGPQCICGSVMKKTEHPMVFTYLNFLREESGTAGMDRREGE